MKWGSPWLMVSLSIIVAFVVSGEASAQTTERISVDSTGVEGDGDSLRSSISSDGRYVAFDSLATNLVAGDANGSRDVFVYGSLEQDGAGGNGGGGGMCFIATAADG